MGAKKSVRRRRAGGKGEGSGGAGGTPGREGRAKRHTPEERRAAVEAFHKSGLTQKAFARQWDVSHVTLGAWLRKHAAEGPQGLERVASGPAKRRGRAPLPTPVRDEVVAVQRRFATEAIRLHVVDAERHVIVTGLAILRLAADRAAALAGADFDPVHDAPWLEGDDLVVPRASVPAILEVLEEADMTWFVGRVPGMLAFLADRIRGDALARGWPTRATPVLSSDPEIPAWPGARWPMPSVGA